MKKWLIAGTVAVLAGAGAAAPFVTGMRAESAFRANLEALSQHPRVEASLIRYNRHWLGAEAESRVVLTGGEERLTLRLAHAIRHGPRPGVPGLAEVTSTPIIPKQYQEAVRHYYGDTVPITADLRIGLGGAQTLTVSSPPFSGSPLGSPEAEAQWGGLSGRLKLAGDRASGTLALTLPGLSLHDAEGDLEVGEISAHSRFERQRPAIWLADTDFSARGLDLAFPASGADTTRRVQITDLSGSQVIERGADADFLRMESRWQVARADLDGQSVRNAELALEADHLHIPTLQDLNRRTQALQQRDLGEDELARRTLAVLRDLLPRFLQHSPRLAITRLAFEAPQGDLEGRAMARYRGGEGGDAREALARPARLLQRTTAEAELSLTRPLLIRILEPISRQKVRQVLGAEADPEQVDRAVERMVRQRLGMAEALGLVAVDGERYTTEARWEEGRITVNGRPLNGLAQGLSGAQ